MRTRPHCSVLLFLPSLLLAGTSLRAEPAKLPRAEPESVGMRAAKLAEIDSVVAEEIAKGAFPGCVVAVGRHGKLVLLKAYGQLGYIACLLGRKLAWDPVKEEFPGDDEANKLV